MEIYITFILFFHENKCKLLVEETKIYLPKYVVATIRHNQYKDVLLNKKCINTQ